MESFARVTKFKGIVAVELSSNNYYAVVANTLGSNILRFRDNKNDIEIFRYSDNVTISEIMNAPEIWGLPTLYLPNRFDAGVLKTSDAVYNLPVNESRFGNHLHGFIQKRSHKIKDMGVNDDGSVYLITSYKYDENDFFYNCFPIKFTVEIKISLSSNGLEHEVCLFNESNVMMPVSIATHTTYNAPFVNGADQKNIRLTVPAEKKLQFNKKRWLPNGRFMNLNDYDLEYVNGKKCPVLVNICNDMYSTTTTKLNKQEFRGTIMTDKKSGKSICNEIDENYKFWIVWNDEGFKNYFCVEPMTAQVNAPNLNLPQEKTGYTEIKPGDKYIAKQRFFTKIK